MIFLPFFVSLLSVYSFNVEENYIEIGENYINGTLSFGESPKDYYSVFVKREYFFRINANLEISPSDKVGVMLYIDIQPNPTGKKKYLILNFKVTTNLAFDYSYSKTLGESKNKLLLYSETPFPMDRTYYVSIEFLDCFNNKSSCVGKDIEYFIRVIKMQTSESTYFDYLLDFSLAFGFIFTCLFLVVMVYTQCLRIIRRLREQRQQNQ